MKKLLRGTGVALAMAVLVGSVGLLLLGGDVSTGKSSEALLSKDNCSGQPSAHQAGGEVYGGYSPACQVPGDKLDGKSPAPLRIEKAMKRGISKDSLKGNG